MQSTWHMTHLQKMLDSKLCDWLQSAQSLLHGPIMCHET